MKDDTIGIAKRDIAKGEEMLIPIDLGSGELLPNDYINFVHGTKLQDLKHETE